MWAGKLHNKSVLDVTDYITHPHIMCKCSQAERESHCLNDWELISESVASQVALVELSVALVELSVAEGLPF